MDNRRYTSTQRRKRYLRRRKRRRLAFLLLLLLLFLLLSLSYCRRKKSPSPATSTPPTSQSTDATLSLFDQTIALREVTIAFGTVDYTSDHPTVTEKEYAVPKELHPQLISLLQEHLNYRQGPGNGLDDIPGNYMVLKLNLNEKLEIRNNDDFVSAYVQDTEGKDIPDGKYMHINYYNATGKMQYVYLSKDNFMEALKSFVQNNQLQGQEIVKGQ